MAAAKQGCLRDPIVRGVRAFDMSSYTERYAEVLTWAEHIKEIAKKTGVGLTCKSFAKEALEDKLFRSKWEKKLKNEEKEKERLENARLAKEEADRIARTAQDIVIKSNESSVTDADVPSGPGALLSALGMGDTEPVDEMLKRVTFQLKKVLHRMGFNVEKLVREALDSMVTRACWGTKFNTVYYDFLTQPAKYINDYWVMLDESLFYAGDGELTGIVKGHEAHIQKKGTFNGLAWSMRCCCILRSSAQM